VETGEPIGYLEWREDVLQETGADFLLMHVSCEASHSKIITEVITA
jgi:hypothetical protein